MYDGPILWGTVTDRDTGGESVLYLDPKSWVDGRYRWIFQAIHAWKNYFWGFGTLWQIVENRGQRQDKNNL